MHATRNRFAELKDIPCSAECTYINIHSRPKLFTCTFGDPNVKASIFIRNTGPENLFPG